MNVRLQTVVLAPVLLALAAAQPAHAEVAYVIANGTVSGFTGSQNVFGTLDLQSGLFSAISAPLPSQTQVYALGFGSNGTLYGLGPDGGTGTDLYSVATGTGTFTLLNDLSGAQIYGGTADSSGIFDALTQPTTANHDHSTLVTVDPVAQTLTVGHQTFVSADGLVISGGSGGLYASDNNVTASGTDGLDQVTQSNGATAYVGDTGLSYVYTGVYSGGQLYTFGSPGTSLTSLLGVYTLDTSTGAASMVTATSIPNDTIYAAALAPAGSPAPEPSQVGMLALMGLGLGGLLLRARRRA